MNKLVSKIAWLWFTTVLCLAAFGHAATLNGYYEPLSSETAVNANTDIDRQCTLPGGAGGFCKFTANGNYHSIEGISGVDNFILFHSPNATLGFSAELDMGVVRGCSPTCGVNGEGVSTLVHGIPFGLGQITTNQTWAFSNSCGATYIPTNTNAGTPLADQQSTHIVIVATPPNHFTIAGSNMPGCNLDCTSCYSNVNWEISDGGTSFNSSFYKFASGMIWNPNDGHTFDLETTNETAKEFDQGLKDFASGLGFKTPASQTFFTLIAIGLSEVTMAFLTGFFGEGKWRIWVIHGVAASVGIICVLLGYTQFWVVCVAIVLATTIVSGGRETIDTFKKLAKAGVKYAAARIGARSGAIPEGADAEVMGGSVEDVEDNDPEQANEDAKLAAESDDVQESIDAENEEAEEDGGDGS